MPRHTDKKCVIENHISNRLATDEHYEEANIICEHVILKTAINFRHFFAPALNLISRSNCYCFSQVISLILAIRIFPFDTFTKV